MTSFVLRLPFRVIDLTAYSGDLWYSSLRTVPSGAFFSLRCLIYKVHALDERNIAILTDPVSFVNTFFQVF